MPDQKAEYIIRIGPSDRYRHLHIGNITKRDFWRRSDGQRERNDGAQY